MLHICNELYPFGCKYNESFSIYTLSGIISLFIYIFYTLSGIKLKLITIAALQYSLNIFGAIVDAVVDFRVWQSPTIPKGLQSARTNLQCLTDILIVHPSLIHLPLRWRLILSIRLTHCPRRATSSSKVCFSMLIISLTISFLH